MPWNIAQAKQRFSEVIRQTAEEPQLIYNRGHLVRSVVDAEDFEAFQPGTSVKGLKPWEKPLRSYGC